MKGRRHSFGEWVGHGNDEGGPAIDLTEVRSQRVIRAILYKKKSCADLTRPLRECLKSPATSRHETMYSVCTAKNLPLFKVSVCGRVLIAQTFLVF
jgi:hypothetical protein